MFVKYYEYRFENGIIIFESKDKIYEFKLNEIRKIQIYPLIFVHRSLSGICIYGKRQKLHVTIKTVNDYESIVKQIHQLVIGNGITYIKGSNFLRVLLIVALPFWVIMGYLIGKLVIDSYVEGYHCYNYASRIFIFLSLINFPKNFKDTKIETYDPEIIIRFGPRIFYDKFYLRKVIQEEDLN